MRFRSRDPIHNFIDIPEFLAPLVNCKALQRLRGIRQLALASLVYPGALHTRFDHTLGVTHVAGLMAKCLGIDGDELDLIYSAGLLHDTGHGPFSHVSEASLEWFGDEKKIKPGMGVHKIHEAITAEIVQTDAEISRILPQDSRDRVVQLLNDWKGRSVLKQIVSGPLDADKQDYLLRDSYFCGVQYGHYDLYQLHRSLKLPDPDGELMIDEDGIHAVEQYVLAKYYMTTNVYRHRVRIISDQMITRAIRLGIEKDQLHEMEKLFKFDGSPDFTRNYLQWDDARFVETFCPLYASPPGVKSGEMLKRLRERRLLKEVFKDSIGNPYDSRSWETLKGLHKRSADKLATAVAQDVAEYLNRELSLPEDKRIDPDFVIVHSYNIKSARETSKNEEAGILVNVRPNPQPFTQESTLFRSINEAYSDNFIVIYAPIEWPDPAKKDELRTSWKAHIRSTIQEQWKKVKP